MISIQEYNFGASSYTEDIQYFHGDLPPDYPDEHHQPGHQLHQGRGQIPDHSGSEHHLPHGSDLHLPLSF